MRDVGGAAATVVDGTSVGARSAAQARRSAAGRQVAPVSRARGNADVRKASGRAGNSWSGPRGCIGWGTGAGRVWNAETARLS